MTRRAIKILCLFLAFLLLGNLLVSCHPEPPAVPPGTDPEDPPAEEPEVYIPHTTPQLRQEGDPYLLRVEYASCSKGGTDRPYYHLGSGTILDYCRFADKNQMIIYRFDLHDHLEPTISMRLANDYKIEISPDAKKWTFVYSWLDDNPSCNNRANEGDFVIDPYEYEVYDVCYIRLSDADPSDGHGAMILSLEFNYYEKITEEQMNIFDLTNEDYAVLDELAHTTPAPSDVSDGYEIHRDGGMIYNPISREKAEELDKYDDGEWLSGRVEQTVSGTHYILDYEIPRDVTAYDAIPIRYTLTSSRASSTPVHISATAFDDPAKENDTLYYDLTLPGRVDLSWEYLGYVGATDDLSNRAIVSSDDKRDREGAQYPQYDTTDLILSGQVQSHSMLWWKFRYTNTGNTILDGDGNGTFCVEANLYRKNASGEWEHFKAMENLYNRIIEEVYPGESGEMYFIFDHNFNMAPGQYKIVINGLVRNETSNPENYGNKIWGGETYTSSEFTFEVVDDKVQTTPSAVVKTLTKTSPTRNAWLHSYEEFMSSYASHLKGVTTAGTTEILYLQTAPWTEQVVLRLIVGNGNNLAAVAIPIEVESDSIKVTFNPDNQNYVVLEDGTRFPAISAQSMADMRGNVQLGPDAAGNVLADLLAMKECGINLINTTAAFEFDGSYATSSANNTDACWFMLDALRELGLTVQGWVGYPYEGSGAVTQANTLFNSKIINRNFASQELARANGLNAIWQYERWGDNYWVADDGTIVLDIEDTRGWMRIDYNARHIMNASSKQNFRLFLMDLYGTIHALNRDWDTDYASFEEIDPEEGTTADHSMLSYKNDNIVFCEWSRPLELLDQFLTLERIRDYTWVLQTTAEVMPTAMISVRTEGANWMVSVDPETESSHLRHVYYSQRRCAIVPELMAASGIIYSHADYTTLPYTPSEVAELTRASTESGIVSMLLPQFNRMRDIAINDKYGNDFSYEYNLETQTKGAYISTVCSVFEWFRAAYENGGVPGILWQDYLCDGYATATQRKEIAFFTQKLTEAMDTPEGRAWATSFEQNTSVLEGSEGKYTFDPDYVRALIEKAQKEREE